MAEFELDRSAGHRPGQRRQAVLQECQIGGDLLAEQVGPGRQQLAELDKARAELVECCGQALTGARRQAPAPAREQPGKAHIEGEDWNLGKQE